MLPTPKKFKVVAGGAEGKSKLTAFDNALLQAGVGNVNLLKVSSILPPSCTYDPDFILPLGALTPIAYGSIVSDVPGETIVAAVAVGIPEQNTMGVIMEYSGKSTKEEAEMKIRQMVEEAFEVRNLSLKEIKVCAVEHKVSKIGCAFAAVPLWY